MIPPRYTLLFLSGFIFFLPLSLKSECEQDKNLKFSEYLIKADGSPSTALKNLTNTLAWSQNLPFEKIKYLIKKEFGRPFGVERWEVPSKFQDQKKTFIPLLRDLGLVCKKMPAHNHYAYAIVFGGILSRVHTRIGFLANIWNQGVRFDQIVFLGSDRLLVDDIEGRIHLKKFLKSNKVDFEKKKIRFPQTEIELMEFVFEYSKASQKLKKISKVSIKTPHGSQGRAPTGESVEYWMNTNPKPGRLLLISSQPLIGYQSAISEPLFSSDFPLDIVGAGVDPEKVEISQLLDALSDWTNRLNRPRKRPSL